MNALYIPNMALLILLTVSSTQWLSAADKKPATQQAAVKMSPEQQAFFENKIRPVLAKYCYSCHSSDAKELAGKLLLDSRSGMLEGGESGPTVVAGDPEKSLLIQALKYDGLEMPPEKPLPEAVVNDFIKWVEMGAPDPRTKRKNETTHPVLNNQDGSLWSFQPIRKPDVPHVKNEDWPRDSLDHFILAKMTSAGLTPTADAKPAVLLRRLYYDLIGLPPTKQQIDQFVSNYNQHDGQATEQVVDELLASPHFGERWGRHWLDVARYGESNGNDGLGRNPTFPHAWRYRDYVIQSLNDDVPYDRFLTEQIAGDLLEAESDAERDRLLIATGFLAIGSKPAKAMNNNFEMDVVNDQINVVSTGVMGLSVACARCHDHKHDPIPTRDYYALAGIFKSTETLWGLAAKSDLTAPRTPLHELKAAPRTAPPTKEELKMNDDFAGRNKAKKSNFKPTIPLAMGVREQKKPADCKINIKRKSNKTGPVVPRGFLTACGLDESKYLIDENQSGRLQLAQWLTADEHPQTARVLVNRIWLHLFGQAIVGTPDDFGVYGDRPTHPDLLDHLATRFKAEQKWSIKQLIRSIVLSRTYQLSSHGLARSFELDPNNIWYSRHKRRRLDAESFRDSILQVSGQLDRTPGQGSLIENLDILVNRAGHLHRPGNHRSVYLCLLRNAPPPELAAFDLPEGIEVAGKRNVTTLPAQALFLLNSEFLVEQSQQFAVRLLENESDNHLPGRIAAAYRLALARHPQPVELERAKHYLQELNRDLKEPVPDEQARQQKVWTSFCQALFATNEFRYID